MDSGAYGSYPSMRRRRYNIGKYINRKYNGKRAPYRTRVNPVNQYTFRKTRVGRLTKTQLTSIKATYTDAIVIGSSSSDHQFLSTGLAYLNLTAILQGSPEYVSRFTQYSYYMINGMSVTYTRRWIDPISLGVNGVSPGFTSLRLGLPAMSTNFYPNLSTTVVGQPVEDADSSWITSPFIHGRQTHYQPFPKNFTTGTNSNGLGVWNACSQIANLSGELAIYAQSSAPVSDQGAFYIFDVEVNVYVAFCNNTGT